MTTDERVTYYVKLAGRHGFVAVIRFLVSVIDDMRSRAREATMEAGR